MRAILGSRVLLLIFAFVPTLVCPAQTASQATDKRFKLEGTVINSVTGQPIPRALVQITATPARAMLTGPEGEFSFDNLREGPATVAVDKPGFIHRPALYGNGARTQKSIQVGDGTGKMVLKLTPEAVIYGQITGADEEPVEGAEVELLSLHTVRGQQKVALAFRTGFGLSPMLPSQVQTDEDGNYRIAGLAPGNYYLVVKTGVLALRRRAQARTGFAVAKDTSAYPAVIYYPDAPDFDSAMPIQVLGGQRLAADFSLKRMPTFAVAGTVHGSSVWKQLNPPIIVDETGQALFTANDFADNGEFSFNAVPAGNYTVQLGGQDQNGIYHSAYRKLVVAGPVSHLKLNLPAPLDIPVIVHNEFTKPLPAAQCSSTGPDGQLHVSDCSDHSPVGFEVVGADILQDSNNIMVGYGPNRDPNNLKVRGVMPGRYWVRAGALLGGYVAALRSGSVDLLREPLVVPEEGGVPPIEVTLRNDSAEVDLRVHSDTPGQRAWAVLVPDLLTVAPVIVDLKPGTDRDYDGLPPGTYKVFAVDSIDTIDISDPESFEKYAQAATTVTLTANGSTTVSLQLLHAGD